MLPRPGKPQVELFFGKSETGKTRLALSRIGPDRALLFDSVGQEGLARNAVVVETASGLVAALEGNARRICWRGFVSMGDSAFDFANRCAWTFGNLALLWDEADMLMSVHPVPPFAYRIINAGRHRGLRIFATARRPASMSRHLTAAATAAWSFTVTGTRDLKYLAEFFDREAANLPGLGRGHALHWIDSGNTVEKKIY